MEPSDAKYLGITVGRNLDELFGSQEPEEAVLPEQPDPLLEIK